MEVFAAAGRCSYEVDMFVRNGGSDPESLKLGAELLKKAAESFRTDVFRRAFNALTYDVNLMRSAMFAEKFKQLSEKKIYRFNSKFLMALSRMDVELRSELLPQSEFSAYFSFEDDVLADADGERLIGAYVFLRKPVEGYDKMTEGADFVFSASVFPHGPSSGLHILTFGNPTTLIAGIHLGATFSDSYFKVPVDTSGLSDFEKQLPRNNGLLDEKVFRTLINAVMYLHSLNPDVTHLKPVSQQTSRERKETVKNGLELNNSIYPLVYVSWNYGKGVVYSKDSTMVRTHFRWQPCGPGRGQTKLIMIQEHERHFKNVTPDISTSASP